MTFCYFSLILRQSNSTEISRSLHRCCGRLENVRPTTRPLLQFHSSSAFFFSFHISAYFLKYFSFFLTTPSWLFYIYCNFHFHLLFFTIFSFCYFTEFILFLHLFLLTFVCLYSLLPMFFLILQPSNHTYNLTSHFPCVCLRVCVCVCVCVCVLLFLLFLPFFIICIIPLFISFLLRTQH